MTFTTPKGRKFDFIPAALFPKDHAGLGAYIKYGRPKGFSGDEVVLKAQTAWWKHFLTPDREILLVKDGYRQHQMRPLDDGWHEFVSWSQFHATANSFDDAIYMVNYAQHFMECTPEYNFQMANTLPYGKGRDFMYIADSGGFQIFKQRVDFIAPADAARWYHNNVELGVAIDVPVLAPDHALLMEAAHVQKANNVEMVRVLKELDSHVQLVNVSHGMSYDQQMEYLGIVEMPEIRRLAISGAYRTSVFAAIHLISRLMYSLHERYDHFHILGVYNLNLLPALILMANQYPIKYMTSDASTHLMSGVNKMYHHQVLPETPMRRIAIGGKKEQATRLVSSGHKMLPCNCPVCSSLKYFDVISQHDGSAMAFTLAQHNLQEISRYVKFMDHMAKVLEPKDYIALVTSQASNKQSAKETHHALQYIYDTAKSGDPLKHSKKYSMYLSDGIFSSSSTDTSACKVLYGEDFVPDDAFIQGTIVTTRSIIEKYNRHHKEEAVATAKTKLSKEKPKGKKGTAMFSKKKKLNSKGKAERKPKKK